MKTLSTCKIKHHNEIIHFVQMLETKDMFLKPDDKEELLKQFPEGKVVYKEFQPIAKEVILRVYRAKDESDVSYYIHG